MDACWSLPQATAVTRPVRAWLGIVVASRAARAAQLVVVTVLLGACTEVGFGPPYPGQITEPEVIGVVASATTDADGTTHVGLADGRSLEVRPTARAPVAFPPGKDMLLIYGTTPEPWYLTLSFAEELGCYWLSAGRAFSEPDAVVLAYVRWSGVGIRLKKAPDFDDSRLVTTHSDGHPEFMSAAFCLDAEGRLSGI